MTMIRIVAATLATTFALATGPARAEMKTESGRVRPRRQKLKGYLAYDDKVSGKRPAILMIHDRAGMQPYTLKHAEN